MDKRITTRAHGVIDYAWAAASAALPRTMDDAPSTGRLLQNLAMAATVISILTKYEAGMLRVIPMKGHLALDAVMYTALLASPFFLPDRERRWAAVPVALGAAGLMTGMMTETRSPIEVRESLRRDANLEANPWLRRKLE